MSSSYRQELEKWLKTLDVKAGSVLDIGGSQLPIKDRVRSWAVDNYKIADLETPHVGSPKPDIEFDMNEIYTPFKEDRVDLVFCLEVFEYIWNPVQAMQNIAQTLKEGGEAWVTFPFFYPTHQPLEEDCLRYTQFGIKKLADYAGLTIEEIAPRRPETRALQTFFASERMRAAKDYDHNVTGWIVKFRKPS